MIEKFAPKPIMYNAQFFSIKLKFNGWGLDYFGLLA